MRLLRRCIWNNRLPEVHICLLNNWILILWVNEYYKSQVWLILVVGIILQTPSDKLKLFPVEVNTAVWLGPPSSMFLDLRGRSNDSDSSSLSELKKSSRTANSPFFLSSEFEFFSNFWISAFFYVLTRINAPPELNLQINLLFSILCRRKRTETWHIVLKYRACLLFIFFSFQ